MKTLQVKRLSDILPSAFLRMATVDEDDEDVTSIYADVLSTISHQARQRAGRQAHIPGRAPPSNFDQLLAPRLFFMLHNRIPHIVPALVNTCFHSSWIHNASVRR